MTFNLKRLTAAVALATAGLMAANVNAAISDDNGGTPFTGSGAGELFFQAVSFTDNKSISIDSGITAASFLANPAAGWSFGANAALANFIATATGPVIYNIGAVHNGDLTAAFDPSVWGILASSAGPIGADPTLLGFAPITASMGTHADFLANVNGVGGIVGANLTKVVTDPAAPDFWWGNNAGQLGFDNTAAIDQSLGMFYITLDLDADPGGDKGKAVNVLQNWFWSVDAGTGEISYATALAPVPIPAAAWLFGSALVGLVGIGRRRT